MRRVLMTALAVLATAATAHALDLTPAQSEGPYFPRTKPAEADSDLTRVGTGAIATGDVLALSGKVVDPNGQPIAGTRVEIWQTDAKGIYMHPGDPRTAQRDMAFQFYGEAISGENGAFAFRTIMPGLYTGRPRHIHAKVTPPGGATLTTQFYFVDDADLAKDGIARRLGRALASVTLKPIRAGGELQASVTVVVPRAKR